MKILPRPSFRRLHNQVTGITPRSISIKWDPPILDENITIESYIRDIDTELEKQNKINTDFSNETDFLDTSNDNILRIKEVIEKNDNIINYYNKIINNIKNLDSTLSKYFIPDKNDKLKIDIQKTIDKYRKIFDCNFCLAFSFQSGADSFLIWSLFVIIKCKLFSLIRCQFIACPSSRFAVVRWVFCSFLLFFIALHIFVFPVIWM
jgi:hypothetical protein